MVARACAPVKELVGSMTEEPIFVSRKILMRPISPRVAPDAAGRPGTNDLDPAGRCRHHNVMLIFKIFRTDEWALLRREGETAGAPIDVADGYVHFSTAAQAAETAAKHFAGAEGLFLIAVDADALGDSLKWEPSRNDDLFPHLYRKLMLADVVWAQPLPLERGVHQFPVGLEEASA